MLDINESAIDFMTENDSFSSIDIPVSNTLFDSVLIVGIGGTGSHLVDPLVRLMLYHPNGCKNFVLCDGDDFSESNKKRQLHHVVDGDLNKARLAANKMDYLVVDNGGRIAAIENYLNPINFDRFLKEVNNPLIIMLPDNHATRKFSLDFLDKTDKNFVWITAGNSLDKGQVICYGRQEKDILGIDPRISYADIADPEYKEMPRKNSCQDLAPSTPQLIGTNAMASTIVLNMVQNILDGTLTHTEVFFDTVQMKVQAQCPINYNAND